MPRLSGVRRFVDAVAVGEILADVTLAGTGVDDLGVRRGNLNVADAVGDFAHLPVGDVIPGVAVIFALPDAALNGAHIKEIRLIGNTRYGDDSAADVRADATPFEFAHQFLRCRVYGTRRRDESPSGEYSSDDTCNKALHPNAIPLRRSGSFKIAASCGPIKDPAV